MLKNAPTLSRRHFLAWAGASTASLAVPGLAHGESGKKLTILHGSGEILLAWAPSYVAEAMGYYKDEGFSVERIFNGSGPAGLTALVSGSGTFLLAPPGELLVGVARGQKLKILMAESNYQAVHFVISKEYAAKHGITRDTPVAKRLAAAKQFKGIRCAVTTPGSLSDHAARAALKGAGLDPAADAQILPLGSVPNAMAAMGRGNIDAFTGASPAPETAESKLGAVVLFSVGNGEIPGFKALSGQLLNARAVDVEQNPELFSSIVRADIRGLRYIVENSKAAGDLLYKNRYSSMSPELWAVVWERNVSQFATPYVPKESVEAWATMGIVPGSVDTKSIKFDSVIDMRFVDQAIQKIGWKVTA
jgi:NitT/TauT family transport system substrate-binding protein